MSGHRALRKKLQVLQVDLIQKPESFVVADEEAASLALKVTGSLFNQGKKTEWGRFGTFKEIPEAKYDTEQVWAILEDRQGPLDAWMDTELTMLEEAVSSLPLPGDEEKGTFDEMNDEEDQKREGEEEEEEQVFSYDEEEDFSESEEEEEEEEEEKYADNDKEEDGQISYDEDIETNSLDDEPAGTNGDKQKEEELWSDDDEDMTNLHDGFFTATDMEKFSEKVEKAEYGDDDEEGKEEEEEEEEEIDYFQDPDEEGDDEDEEAMVDASDIMYKDFFKPPRESGLRRAKQQARGTMAKKRSVHFSMDKDIAEENEEDEEAEEAQVKSSAQEKTSQLFADSSDEEGQEGQEPKSKFQKQQERLKEQIEALEAESIAKKAWTMGGEAGSKARPVNSLLEEDLVFDHANKIAPTITVEKTESLEDLIKQRILDNHFDDVVRKRDPKADRPFRPSSAVELDDQKSKQSLAEIYEEEYVRSTAENPLPTAKEEELRTQHEEIDAMWRVLRSKLDALTDSHYVPKAPAAEVKVVSDAPALMMEEAQPTATGMASRLAPEEVYDKQRGQVKGDTELTQEERKRLRNRKKRLYKRRQGAKPLERAEKVKALGED